MVEHPIHAFRTVPRTGVVYVTTEAGKGAARHLQGALGRLGEMIAGAGR